jgi:hypothetical protein
MKPLSLLLASSLLLLAPLAPCAAEEGAKFDFSSPGLPEGWSAAKGEWTVAEGALVGKELAADEHAAVLMLPDPHADSTITLRFRLDGAEAFHLSYNHERGHLFRIAVKDGTASLVMDKDKRDPESKPRTLATASFEAGPDGWVELVCSIRGESVEARIGGAKLAGSDPALAKAKTGYRFIVRGASVRIGGVAYESSK